LLPYFWADEDVPNYAIYYAAVLIGRSTYASQLFVRLSVCLSIRPVQAHTKTSANTSCIFVVLFCSESLNDGHEWTEAEGWGASYEVVDWLRVV